MLENMYILQTSGGLQDTEVDVELAEIQKMITSHAVCTLV